jgi:hypothetical protein
MVAGFAVSVSAGLRAGDGIQSHIFKEETGRVLPPWVIDTFPACPKAGID